MNISPIIFFDMTIAILVLAITLVIIVFYLSKITKIIHGNTNFQNDIDPLYDAKTKAIKIIDDANNKAIDIVSNVTLSKNTALENFKQEIAHVAAIQTEEFEKATSEFTKSYFQTLQELKIKNIEAFQNVSKDIEMNSAEEIKNFKESLQKITTSSQNEVQKKIETEYLIAKKEIDDYRREGLEKTSAKIYEILEKTAKIVFNKAINLSEHEDLIIKSLETAKKGGLFGIR